MRLRGLSVCRAKQHKVMTTLIIVFALGVIGMLIFLIVTK